MSGKIVQVKIYILTALFLFLCGAPAISADSDAPAAGAQKISPRQINQSRERLLIGSRQLLNTVKGEMRSEALRNKNRLTRKIYNLESSFSGRLFEEIHTGARWVALVFGTDVEMMAGYYRLATLIIARVEPVQTLRESYGVAYSSNKARQEDVEEFRRGLKENVSVAYLRHLLAENPEEAVSGFRSYTEALRKLQVAEQFKAEAEVMEVTANQELMRDLAGGVPLLGDAIDVIGVATGEDAFTGEKLTAAQRSFDALLIMVPEALEALLAKSPQLAGSLKKTLAKLNNADSATLKRLGSMMKHPADDLSALKKKIKDSLAAAEHRTKKIAGAMLEKFNSKRIADQNRKFDKALYEIKDVFDKTTEGADAKRLWEAAEKQGRDNVARLDNILKKSAAESGDLELLEAYQTMRQDKRALTNLQDSGHQQLREQIQKVENKLFSHVDQTGAVVMGKVDVDAIDNLKKGFDLPIDAAEIAAIRVKKTADLLPEDIIKLKTAQARDKIISAVKSHGAKNGAGPSSAYLDEALDFKKMEITVFNATNKPPAPGKVGFDRDITYQAVIPEKKISVRNPRTGVMERVNVPAKKIDIPAELVEEHYHTSLYKNLNPGRKTLPSRQEILEFGRKMDHQVTDGLHKDAYRLGMDNITDFFKDPTLLARQGVRVEDFTSTVIFKSEHCFEAAARAKSSGRVVDALTETAEGMRQASKQYDNYMTKLLAYQGLNAVDNLPEKLQKGMHVFQSVSAGKISVPQAEAALKAMGMTKEKVVQLFGQYFESTVKLAHQRELLKTAAATTAKTAARSSGAVLQKKQGESNE